MLGLNHRKSFPPRGAVAIAYCLFVTAATATEPQFAQVKPAHESPRRRFALLIGIDEYRKSRTGFSPLAGAQNDVRLLDRVLVREYRFARKDVVLLINENATAANIRKAFKNLARMSRPGDVIVVYFAGHGTQLPDDNGDELLNDPTDKLDEAIVPYDAAMSKAKSGDVRFENYIRDDELGQMLDALPAREQVVVFDCCHSGTATRTPDGQTIRGRSHGAAAEDAGKESTGSATGSDLISPRAGRKLQRIVLSACAARQQAVEVPVSPLLREVKTGLFTKVLIEGLRGPADANGDGKVSYEEAFQYTKRRLRRLRPDQTPQRETAGKGLFLGRTAFGVDRKTSMYGVITWSGGEGRLDGGAVYGFRPDQTISLYASRNDLVAGKPPMAKGRIDGVGRNTARIVPVGRIDRRPQVAAPDDDLLATADVFVGIAASRGRHPDESQVLADTLRQRVGRLSGVRVADHPLANVWIILDQNRSEDGTGVVIQAVIGRRRSRGKQLRSRPLTLRNFRKTSDAFADELMRDLRAEIRRLRVCLGWTHLANPKATFQVRLRLEGSRQSADSVVQGRTARRTIRLDHRELPISAHRLGAGRTCAALDAPCRRGPQRRLVQGIRPARQVADGEDRRNLDAQSCRRAR